MAGGLVHRNRRQVHTLRATTQNRIVFGQNVLANFRIDPVAAAVAAAAARREQAPVSEAWARFYTTASQQRRESSPIPRRFAGRSRTWYLCPQRILGIVAAHCTNDRTPTTPPPLSPRASARASRGW
jgi:hypothetical protein